MNPYASFLWLLAVNVAAGLLFTLTASVSLAQAPLVSNDVAWPGLTQDDIDRMHAAAARLYEGHSIGTVERWRSPDSRDAGEIKLIRSFNANGMPCRTLAYTIRFEVVRDNPSQYVVNWCKVQGGGVEDRRTAPVSVTEVTSQKGAEP
jgi:hypothetical protein